MHVSKGVKHLEKIVINYESTPAEFDEIIEAAFSRNKQEVEALWDQCGAMLTHIKRDEWQAIVSSGKSKAEVKTKK